MVNEVSILKIDPAEEKDFVETYEKIKPLIARQPGFHSTKLLKVLENNYEYILTIIWDSKEAHTAFVNSEDFIPLNEQWGPFQKEVIVRHGITVVDSESL